MSVDIITVVTQSIGDSIEEVQSLQEEELLMRIAPWLNEVSLSERFAGTPRERFKHWMDSTLLPTFRRLGQNGQTAWEIIRDPASAYSKERIASAVLFLAVAAGMQTADISTLVAIVILAIRSKSAEG